MFEIVKPDKLAEIIASLSKVSKLRIDCAPFWAFPSPLDDLPLDCRSNANSALRSGGLRAKAVSDILIISIALKSPSLFDALPPAHSRGGDADFIHVILRFTLDIQIFIDEDPKAQRHVLLKSIVEDTALIKSIADLKEQMVDIVVSDYEFDGTGWTEDVVTYFGLLVWAIMVATQGACESLGGFMEYFEDEDDDHDEDKSYYEWSWHLRPTLAPPSRRR